ncbi:hypothetical protein AR689_20680 [Arthrobacter sp. EpRS71]|nr:hypothetical protein AR689_20680 [Arthrobacter sp. EpRS71]
MNNMVLFHDPLKGKQIHLTRSVVQRPAATPIDTNQNRPSSTQVGRAIALGKVIDDLAKLSTQHTRSKATIGERDGHETSQRTNR